jgi:hypothetical protein
MTVGELIEALSKLDPSLPVLGRGYESGYDTANSAEVVSVFDSSPHPWYEGQFQNASPGSPTPFDAVVIQ